jgi:hypothetical protein
MSDFPPLPRNRNVWIDPQLLQLVALGTSDDPYLQDGRHLRWFFGRLLGFPRSGFLLRRHRAPFGSDPDVTKRLMGLMGRVITSEPVLDGGSSWHFPSGITIEKEGAFSYSPGSDGVRYLKIDKRRITISFGPQGTVPAQPIGPGRKNPAAYVLLTIMRRERSGQVVAEGSYDAGSEFRVQDRAAVGRGIRDVLPPTARDLILAGSRVEWLRSSAERRLNLEEIRRRHVELTRDLIRPARPSSLFDDLRNRLTDLLADPWQTETLLLHGGLLDRIVIFGTDALLVRVQWLPTRLYAQLDEWIDVDKFFLPFTGHPTIYPAWTTSSSDSVASDRLLHGEPQALPAWDEPNIPPPPDPAAVEDDLRLRYLDSVRCPAFSRLHEAMKQFLAGELSSTLPQALVQSTEVMTWDGPEPPAGGSEVTFRPFDYVYSASADPNMARLLGLMTSDFKDPDGEWDYVISTSFPFHWLFWTLFPVQAAQARKRKQLDARDLVNWQEMRDGEYEIILDQAKALSGRFSFPIISMATFIHRAPVPLPQPPATLTAVVNPRPGPLPVQAEVAISWQVPATNIFEEPRAAHVFYALRRRGITSDVALHRTDDETKVRLPITPVSDANLESRFHVNDRALRSYGDYTWRLSAMDLWGRFSPWADAPATVSDQVPPLEPANVSVRLNGNAAAAPTWDSATVAFNWTAFQERESQDVVAFEVHITQDKVAKSDNQNAGVWGKLEHVAGSTTAPLRINWPAATLVAPGGGLIATLDTSAIPAADGGGHHIEVVVGPINRPFDAGGFARISATVRAVDAAGNVSKFAPLAVASRVDETPPPPAALPPGPLLGSFPDARGRSFFRLELNTPAALTVQVMRASQAALLKAGATRPEDFEALSEGERVAQLKNLAINHQEVFVADHEFPYGDSAEAHMLELKGLSRDWTIATLQRTSKNGVRGSWPTDADSFAVIAVPRPRRPSAPVFVEARPGDGEAVFRLARDPNDLTRNIRILRTRAQEKTVDIRRMTPVLEIDVAALDPLAEIRATDTNLFPDAIYFYRAVAVGEAGTRSEPGEVIAVRPFSTLPPPAPELTLVHRELSPPNARRLVFTIPRRDYRVTVFRREPPGGWDFIDSNGTGGFIDLTTLTVTSVTAGYEVTLVDRVPDASATYAYFVRITDPRERTADSTELEETQ